MHHKHLLETYSYNDKTRLGVNSDGGYVICNLEGDYDCYICCGVAKESSFDRDFLKLHKNIDAFAFDGTIEDYPYEYTKDIKFIKKNISNVNDDKNTNLHDLIANYDKIFLSIDIEGGEYPWILSLTEQQLQKFKQICIELHGLNDNSWETIYDDKMKCLEKLHNTHYVMHVHGNNYAGIYDGIPDVLEVTYVNKNSLTYIPEKNNEIFPIKGLDFPNYKYRPDYVLLGFPFTEKEYKVIVIGSSETNTKTIDFDVPSDTKLHFVHNFKDMFSYKIVDKQLTITRIDEDSGWGQNLFALF